MNHTFTNCPSRGKRNPKTGALLCPKCWMEEYYYDQKVQREENKKMNHTPTPWKVDKYGQVLCRMNGARK